MRTEAALDPVLLTRQWLASRAQRPSDPVRENAALLALVDEMAQRPDNVLTLLCELILETCHAESAGVSLLREETDDFLWPAVAGVWAPFVRGSMPRLASPCGAVIDCNDVLIFRDVPAQFPATRQATPDIAEIMLAPFHRDGVPIGTVWAVSHDPLRVFDAEDRRMLTSLARFAAAAHQTTTAHQSARENRESLQAAVQLVGLGLYSIEIVNGKSRLAWDDRIRGLWGLADAAEVNYQVWIDGIHPEDRPLVEAAVDQAYDPAGDGLFDVEYRVRGADGVERWIATRGETTFKKGNPVFFLGVALDITERKMIERGLGLVIKMRNSQLEEAIATREAEAQAHGRVSERLELLQSELSRGLFAALESRQRGSPGTSRHVVQAARKIADLTRREREVLDGLVAGEPHKRIAHQLGISARTVELHRARMLHRLGTPHLSDAIRLAVLAELVAE